MIFTLGTSNRSLAEFLTELRRHRITQIVDVRSVPYSRVPEFNAGQITRWAGAAGVLYRQAGDVLGGKSDTAMDDPAFQAALDRLVTSGARENIAIFCAEGDPETCHRSYKVGAAVLLRHGVPVQNIRRDGVVEHIEHTLTRTSDRLLDPIYRALRLPVLDAPQGGLFE